MSISITVQNKLVEGCIQGNPRAQRELYEIYSNKMLALTLRYAKDTMEAEDILMIGFKKIFDRITSYSGTGSFEGWMRRIMINCALNVYQQNQRRICTKPLEYAVEIPVYYPTNNTDTEYLIDALHSIPACLRTAFNLYAIEGFSHKEIALNLGISEVSSKVRVNRARKALREALKPEAQKNTYVNSAA